MFLQEFDARKAFACPYEPVLPPPDVVGRTDTTIRGPPRSRPLRCHVALGPPPSSGLAPRLLLRESIRSARYSPLVALGSSETPEKPAARVTSITPARRSKRMSSAEAICALSMSG